jgi:hypothetical protein
MGHEDQFSLPSLNGRCWSGQATFAGMGGKEDDVPIPAIRTPIVVRLEPILQTACSPGLQNRRLYDFGRADRPIFNARKSRCHARDIATAASD